MISRNDDGPPYMESFKCASTYARPGAKGMYNSLLFLGHTHGRFNGHVDVGPTYKAFNGLHAPIELHLNGVFDSPTKLMK